MRTRNPIGRLREGAAIGQRSAYESYWELQASAAGHWNFDTHFDGQTVSWIDERTKAIAPSGTVGGTPAVSETGEFVFGSQSGAGCLSGFSNNTDGGGHLFGDAALAYDFSALGDWTILCWTHQRSALTNQATDAVAFGSREGANASQVGFGLDTTNISPRCKLGTSNNNAGGSTAPVDSWHHCYARFTGPDDLRVQVYGGGGTSFTRTPTQVVSEWAVGSFSDGTAPFAGYLDDLFFFDSAVGDSHIGELNAGPEPYPVSPPTLDKSSAAPGEVITATGGTWDDYNNGTATAAGQWQIKTDTATDFVDLPGETGLTYSIPGNSPATTKFRYSETSTNDGGTSVFQYSLPCQVAGEGGEVLTANPGTVNVAGESATLGIRLGITANPGTVEIAGESATLNKPSSEVLDATPGVVNIAGESATLGVRTSIDANPGTVEIQGSSAVLQEGTAGELLGATPGVVNVAGESATLIARHFLTADPAGVTIIGSPAEVRNATVLTVSPGGVVVTGENAELTWNARPILNATPGVVSIYGHYAALTVVTGEVELPLNSLLLGSVLDYLRDSPDIRAAVKHRIYSGRIPQNECYPAIVCQEVGGDLYYLLENESYNKNAEIQIDVYAHTYVDALRISELIRLLPLAPFRGVMFGTTIVGSRIANDRSITENPLPSSGDWRYRHSADYSFHYLRPIPEKVTP